MFFQKGREFGMERVFTVDVNGKEIEEDLVLVETDLDVERGGNLERMGITTSSQRFGRKAMIFLRGISGSRLKITN